jgi:hypothetical protein
MELGLKDKAVIVTGSASGIGKAVATTFGEEGSGKRSPRPSVKKVQRWLSRTSWIREPKRRTK